MYGAEIYINNELKGRVPARFSLTRGRKYTVVIRCRDGTSSKPRELKEVRDPGRTDFTYSGRDFRF